MAAEIALDRLQRWMQAVVVHPGATRAAIAGADAAREVAPERLGDVVLPSRTLSPLERVGIYHGMYLLRMQEALVSDYEGLQHFLGERAFFELVRGYVQVHPSRSYSLNRLGDLMPEYIESAPGMRRRGFCADLARLERAVAQAFDAEETQAVSAEAVAAVPGEAWEHARLEPVAGFHLLALRYPVNAYLESLRREDHEHPPASRKDTWVAVYRRDYSVWRFDLERPGYDLLADISGGVPFGEAVARALGRRGRRAPSEDDLFRWFRLWVSGGMFRSISLP
jgi:Putative DNA-binding domain